MFMYFRGADVMENKLTILNYILSSVIITDDNGKIIFVNEPFTKVFEYDNTDIINKDISILIPRQYKKLYERIIKIHKISYKTNDVDIIKTKSVGLKSDGTEFPIAFRLSKIYYKGRNHFLFSIEDLSNLTSKIDDQAKKLIELNENLIDYAITLDTKVDKQVGKIKKINNEIIDSIRYSKKIQDTILNNSSRKINKFINNFILYIPRDIVSGDFYWSHKTWSGEMFIAIGDCTGHGVPGAFLTMLSNSLLNEIIITKRYRDTSKILTQLRSEIIKLLSHKEEGGIKDGLDIVLLKISKDKKKIEFSGANNPLYLLRNGEIKTIKNDPYSIGYETENERKFTKSTMKMVSGDKVYISTDGYQDQFGGENDKKLKRKGFLNLLIKTSSLNLSKQKESLHDFINEWKGDGFQVDDITVLGLDF